MKVYKLLIVGLLFGIGCGGESGTDSPTVSGGGGSGVTLDTTVQDSTSPSASISVGASVGKSVGKGVAKGESAPVIRVAKATSDATVNNASCSCTDLAGKVLATDKTNISGKAEMTIPAGEKQVIIKCTLPDGGEVTNLVDVEGKKAGETVSVGATGPEQDFIFKQIFKEAGFDHAALASKFAAGTLNPKAMYKTIKEMLNETGVSAGSDSVGAAMIAMRNAWKESFANNKPPTFLIDSLKGNASALSEMGGFVGGIDLSTANDHLASFIPACAKTFDATTFAKMEAASSGYDSIAKSFITYKKADMDNIAKNPENFRGLCQNSADKFVAGDASAFSTFTNSNGAALISSIVGTYDPAVFAGDYEAMQKVLQNYKFSSISGASDIATHAAAIGNYFVAMDNPAERDSALKDPTSIGTTLFNKPDVYAASDGAAVAQHIFTIQGNTGGSTGTFTAFTPCSDSFPCAAGSTCNAQHQCVPSAGGVGACTANCAIGTACTSAICGTGLECSGGFCKVTAGTTQKFGGETCANTAECLPPLSCKLHDVLRCSY